MANFEEKNNPEFTSTARKLETTDRAHADLFNNLYQKMFDNDNFLKNSVDKKANKEGGDIANTKVSAFTASSEKFPAPAAGEVSKTLWGKMKKFVEDFKAWYTGVCLIGHIVNNCTSTADNLPLSAAQGKALMDLLTQLNGEIHMVDNLYKTVMLIPADTSRHYYYIAKSFYGSWTGWECYHQHNGRDYQWVDAGTNANTDLVTANYSYGFKKSGIGVLYVNFTCVPKNKGWPYVFGTGFRPRDVRNVYTHTNRNELVQLRLKTNGDLDIDCGNLTTGESCEIRAQIIMSVDD